MPTSTASARTSAVGRGPFRTLPPLGAIRKIPRQWTNGQLHQCSAPWSWPDCELKDVAATVVASHIERHPLGVESRRVQCRSENGRLVEVRRDDVGAVGTDDCAA